MPLWTTYQGNQKTFSEDMVTQDGVKEQSLKDNHQKLPPCTANKCSMKHPVDSDEICPFYIVVFLSTDDWRYLSTRLPPNDPSEHCFHPQQDPELMPSMLKTLEKEELDSLRQCAVVRISPVDASNLYNLPGKVQNSPWQVRYLLYKDCCEQLSSDAGSANRLADFINTT